MRIRSQKTRSLIHEASTAHCDLNIFYAVMALLENGLVSSNHEKAVARITTICKLETLKALNRHDAMRDEIEQRVRERAPYLRKDRP